VQFISDNAESASLKIFLIWLNILH